MKQIKAIVFDLDNTLIDFWKMKKLASKAAITAMIKAGLKIDKRRAWEILGKLFDEYGMENQKIFEIFLEKVTGKNDEKFLAAGVVAYRRVKELHLKTYPNVASTLMKLRKRGLKLAIVTDAPRFQAWTRLFGLKLEKCFDLVVAFEDTGEQKPSHLPFRTALRKLRVKPENVMMIGDSISRDVLGAKKLGMVAVLAKYGQVWKEKEKGKADFEINNFSEILKIAS
jgi:putative hydrolase of the HAD superfamily